MNKKESSAKVIRPVLLVLAAAVLSGVGYFGSRGVDSDLIRPAMAAVLGTTYFISIVFGVGIVFLITSLKGVALGTRILLSSITPFVWMTKEVLLLTQSYPLSQAVYWYLNPLNFGLIFFMTVQMGVCTLIARGIVKRKGEAVKVITPAPVLTILIGLVLTVTIFTWGHGENSYVMFLAGFRALFGAGI